MVKFLTIILYIITLGLFNLKINIKEEISHVKEGGVENEPPDIDDNETMRTSKYYMFPASTRTTKCYRRLGKETEGITHFRHR